MLKPTAFRAIVKLGVASNFVEKCSVKFTVIISLH